MLSGFLEILMLWYKPFKSFISPSRGALTGKLMNLKLHSPSLRLLPSPWEGHELRVHMVIPKFVFVISDSFSIRRTLSPSLLPSIYKHKAAQTLILPSLQIIFKRQLVKMHFLILMGVVL